MATPSFGSNEPASVSGPAATPGGGQAPRGPRPDRAGPFEVGLAFLSILALIAASLYILRPFLGAAVWGATIVVATWPVLVKLERWLWGRRGLAVTVLSLALLGLLVIPFLISVGAIAGNAEEITAWVGSLATATVPPLPQWVGAIPLVGPQLAEAWDKVVGAGLKELGALAAPHAGEVTRWFVQRLGSVGMALAHFLLTVIAAALFWSQGDVYAARIRRFAGRLASDRGDNAVVLAGQAIRGVALGVVLTAIIQTVLGAIGMAIAGVPFVAFLAAVIFFLCVAQLGPVLVLLPATAWVFWSGDTGWGVFLLVWSIPVLALDNFLRPVLIKKGVDLPLTLIFAGVIGGLITMGMIGIFVGPVVLAVTRALAEAWAGEKATA